MATFNQEVYDLQKSLKEAGFDPGPLDGIWGPKTAAALAASHKSATDQVIKQDTPSYDPNVLETQKMLKAAGFDPGPLDGIWGPKTQAAQDAYNKAQAEKQKIVETVPTQTNTTVTDTHVLMKEPENSVPAGTETPVLLDGPAPTQGGTSGDTVLNPAGAQPEKTTQDFINELFSEDEMGYDENFEQISSEEMLNEIF